MPGFRVPACHRITEFKPVFCPVPVGPYPFDYTSASWEVNEHKETFPMSRKPTTGVGSVDEFLADPRLENLLTLSLAVLRQTAEAGLPPERFYKLQFLAGVFEYKSPERFEELLKRNSVPIHSVGKFAKLVKLQDVYDSMLSHEMR